MDKRLQYTPSHYKNRLSSYANDTIEYISPTRLFRYKINKNDNPTVVEELDDYFKIYISEKPAIRLFTYYPRNFDSRTLFFAKIHFSSENVLIKICWNKWQKIIYFVWALFVLGMGVVSSLDSGFGSFVFFLPLLLVAFFTVKIGRKRYQNFIITFLNTI